MPIFDRKKSQSRWPALILAIIAFLSVNAFSAAATVEPAAGDSAFTDDSTDYVVSWSGRYLFAVIDDSRKNPPLHRIFLVETAHPDQRTVIGDYECKGFAGVYCSTDEQWLSVNVAFPVHRGECHVFKNVAEHRFVEVAKPKINDTVQSIFERNAKNHFSFFTFDTVSGLYWKGDTLILLASDRGRNNGDFDDEMFLQYDPAKGQIDPLSKHFVSPMGADAGAKPDPEYEQWDSASLKAYEQSLQHQLKVICNLLLAKLDAAKKAELASEQEQWELTRDKKSPGRYERDLFVQKRINTLSARFMVLR